MIATRAGKPLDSYLHLVRRFPLRAIRTETEHAGAVRMVVRLSGRRGISKEAAKKLAAHFGLEIGAFIA